MFKAYLDEYGKITAVLDNRHYDGISASFYMRDSDNRTTNLKILDFYKSDYEHTYILEVRDNIIGKAMTLFEDHGLYTPIKSRYITTTKKFNNEYYYNGPLGVTFYSNRTVVALFAPTAISCYLHLFRIGDDKMLQMNKDESTGVFTYTTNKDIEGYEYTFILNFNEEIVETIDPYTTLYNSSKTKGIIKKIDKPTRKHVASYQPNEMIIYESNIKDLAYDKKYATRAFYDFTIKASAPNIDYLSALGITHLQIMPIQGIGSIDATRRSVSYNWGYDPLTFFAIDPSFSLDNPNSVISDLQSMVQSLHHSKIQVIYDVVYNHVYNLNTSPLQKTVPYYYFRFDDKHRPKSSSGCGNELATEKLMMRKMILDSIKHYHHYFMASGFRFDLLGLIDLETATRIQEYAIANNLFLLGEGWNMDSSRTDLTTIENAKKVPAFYFFNDRVRESIYSFAKSFNYRSLVDILVYGEYLPRSQSINYIECHDGYTLYDRLISDKYTPSEAAERAMFLSSILLLTDGVVFIHRGQELLGTKGMNSNSYNASHSINSFPSDSLETLESIFKNFRYLIAYRKKIAPYINKFTLNPVDDDESLVKITYSERYQVYINLSSETKNLMIDAKRTFAQRKYYNGVLSPHTVLVAETHPESNGQAAQNEIQTMEISLIDLRKRLKS